MHPTRVTALLLALILEATSAHADIVHSINEARADGCGSHAGIRQGLHSSALLGRVARRLSRGESLHDSAAAEDYLALKASSVHMSGWLTDGTIARNFSRNFCSILADSELRDIGFYRNGGDIWFVLARPVSTLSLSDPVAVSRRVLALVNDARARARRCGRESFAPAGPVRLSTELYRAALEHSRDMARHNYFEHEGSDGSSPAQRVTEQRYRWRVTGENLAAGVVSPEEAVDGWLGSPHHCANLMDPRFTEMGVAAAVAPASKMGVYWTQVFALPRT